MTRIPTLALLIVALGLIAAATPRAQSPSAAALLAAASEKATVDGDLPAAIAAYQHVVDQFARSDRASVAAALVRMGDCYAKTGDRRAVVTYERVVADFADVPDAATTARSRLAAMPTTIEPRHLCDDCGDSNASITPDGKSLVSIDDDTGAVAMRTLGRDDVRQLTHDEPGHGSGDGVVVSSDGRQIVFGWNPGKAGAGYELRMMTSGAGAAPKVILGGSAFKELVPSGFAPDGRLLIQKEAPDGRWQLAWLAPGSGLTTPIADLGWRIQGDVHEASISPNGRYVAFSAQVHDEIAQPRVFRGRSMAPPETHVYVTSATGGSIVDITTVGHHSRSPVWLDDSRLLFISDAGSTLDLWVATVREGAAVGLPALMKRSLGDAVVVGLTKAGILLYQKLDMGVSESSIGLLETNAAGTAPTAQRVIGGRPSWSPDGSSVALSRGRAPMGMGFEIVLRNLATGVERYYDHDGLAGLPPVWFPDGQGLLVIIAATRSDISWYRVDINTGEFRRLAAFFGDDGTWPDWFEAAPSLDGRTIYAGAWADDNPRRLNRVVALDVTTGRYRVVAPLPRDTAEYGNSFAIAVSPDGRHLAVMTADTTGTAHLGLMGIDGRGYREMTTVQNDDPAQKLSWTADGQTLCFAQMDRAKPGRYHVMLIAAAGGQPRDTGVVLDDTERLMISPDGTRVASSDQKPTGAHEEMWSLDVAAILKTIHLATAK